MKEKEFISIIKNSLQSEYIGDDCAYLKDLNIVITQDSLVEDVHFKKEYCTPYQLGYKSVMVNLSDVAASGATPKYITVSLSLPSNIDKNFISKFYNGCKTACADEVKIVGGDITGSDKIFISVCAIGKVDNQNISSRANAQIGQKVVITGNSGSSAAGLRMLIESKNCTNKFVKSHLEPVAQIEFGKLMGEKIKCKYAAMDTSDGLMDALSTIAQESGVLLNIDFKKIPYDKDLEQYENWEDMVLYGGEDYQIVATVPQDFEYGIEIGSVEKGSGIALTKGTEQIHLTKQDIEQKIYNHFNN